jgi:hypothetical protein
MARNFTTPVYKGSLKLDKIVGIRHDKGQRATPIQSLIRKNETLQELPKSMKTVANVTSDGLKKN